jgi:hypothetical protein
VSASANLIASGSLAVSSLTLQPASSTTLAVSPSSLPIRALGNVSLGGNLVVNLAPGLAFGRYPLITHGGTRTGTVTLTGVPPGVPHHVSYTSSELVLFLDDSDEDNLPDTWEQSHFSGLSQTATGDPDGDGTSNLIESRLGLDPASGASSFTSTCIGRTLTWPSAPGIVFTVRRSISLGSTGWQSIGTVTGGPGPTATFTDPESFDRAFYQIGFEP